MTVLKAMLIFTLFIFGLIGSSMVLGLGLSLLNSTDLISLILGFTILSGYIAGVVGVIVHYFEKKKKEQKSNA